MDFITTDQRIAVENFTIGNIYTITFRNAIYFSGSCIGKGADFVSFQRTAPELIFVLTMQTAPTVLTITDGGGGSGTTDYNALNNKPSINGVTLIGALSLSDLGIASSDDLSALERDVDDLTEDQGIDRAALVELVDSGAKNVLAVDELGLSTSHGTTYTHNGVTFTLNADYTVTATRTASSTAQAICNIRYNGAAYYANSYLNGKYVLSGCPADGSQSTYFLEAINSSGATEYQQIDTGAGVTLPNYEGDKNIIIRIRVAADYEADGLIFSPMICLKTFWDISKAFAPYRPSYQELWNIVKAL